MLASVKIFFYKLTRWEFWPFSVFYFPVYFYFIWLAIKCRSFFFFTAANPSIDFGGMLGERKSDIFDLIPNAYLPEHLLVDPKQPNQLDHGLAFASQIGYPLIAKPDVGERGKLVERINAEEELAAYHHSSPVPYLIQAFVDYPIELGVFYVRMPTDKHGHITSIVQKEFLSVTGDGHSPVGELLQQNPRARLQVKFDHPRFRKIMSQVPAKGEAVKVEGIGNHSRGTVFLNVNHRITPKLEEAFNSLCSEIDGFYFGRFDLRCASWEELELLENFKILELNGAGAEPGHIYHPGASLLAGYRSVIQHLSFLAEVSQQNEARGIKYWTLREGLAKLKEISRYNKQIEKHL